MQIAEFIRESLAPRVADKSGPTVQLGALR